MSGMPIVLAASVWLGGVPAALVATPLIGGCAILSFGGLVGRLAGAKWAPVAAAVLALSLPEQYPSRSTFSEPLAQVLLFGGLCLLVDSMLVRPGQRAATAGRAASDEPSQGEPDQDSRTEPARLAPWESREPIQDPGRDWPGQDMVLAGLAGLALGLTILVRVDGLSDIL